MVKKSLKVKKVSRTDLKKEADRLFSIYIRLRDRDSMGLTCCYTCPKKEDMKRMTNGHFASRRHLSTRFDEVNCKAQCWGCNKFHQGEGARFAARLEKDYGPGTVIMINEKTKEICHDFDYQEIIDIYTEKLNQMGMGYLI
jgi:Bacteriophage Lambda NinG protein